MSGYAPRLPFAAQLDPAAAVRRCRTALQPFSVACSVGLRIFLS
jgi:hypothetical protein